MCGHVLLNLSNELGISDKMRGLPGILCLFRNEFNKFINTGARLLDYIYHMTLKLFKKRIFGVKKSLEAVKLCLKFSKKNVLSALPDNHDELL